MHFLDLVGPNARMLHSCMGEHFFTLHVEISQLIIDGGEAMLRFRRGGHKVWDCM